MSNLERLGLQSEDFTQSENRQIFELLKSWLDYEGTEPVPELRDALEAVLLGRYEYLVAYGAQYEPINVDEIERAALRLRERVLKQQIERLRFLEEESQHLAMLGAGSTGVPLTRTSKCVCGPVE